MTSEGYCSGAAKTKVTIAGKRLRSTLALLATLSKAGRLISSASGSCQLFSSYLSWNHAMPSGHPTSARQRGMSASSAVTFVRRLNGASQPIIVLATGCKFYIAKFLDFTGRYGLLGEAVGAGIMRAMGLPTPEWVPLRFTDEFLDAHPEVWYQNTHGTSGIRPGAGLHFASRLVVSADGSEPYLSLPSECVSHN